MASNTSSVLEPNPSAISLNSYSLDSMYPSSAATNRTRFHSWSSPSISRTCIGISVYPPMASKSEISTISMPSISERMSSMGVAKLTLPSISHPPVATLVSTNCVPKVSVSTDMTVSVKMTRANIARVSPVRNLELSG